MVKFPLVVVLIVIVTCLVQDRVTATGSCGAAPRCTCEFPDGTKLPIEPNTEGNEALAGTVGALSSLFVTGTGLGLWYLFKNRSSKFGRSSSSLSDESLPGKNDYDPSNPPPYSETPRKRPETMSTLERDSSRPLSIGTTNVYRATDSVNKGIGSGISSARSYYQGIQSDWM